jgi:hypothetical protein
MENTTDPGTPGPLAAAGIAALLALATTITATGTERREAGRHEHGTSELRIAIDGNDVEVELEGPAANFLGFEYQPSTAAEQQALDDALATLRAPDNLFTWPAAAGCQLVSTEVTPPDYGTMEDDGDHDDAEDDEDGGHNHGDEDGHTELTALYGYRCTQPAALESLRVLVFARFPQTGRLAASVVGPGGQVAATLTPAAAVLKLRP